jgi:serine/threonine-protein kinase
VERTDTGRSNDPLIGRVLDGRYEVVSRVARGGMATVYQARDLRLDRTVAVKVMHAGLGDDPEFVARFEREARSAARLSHHNLVAVFDQGDDNGTLFLVMEYVPGLTLRDLIRKEAPMEAAKALALLEPVLSALAAAHAAGMIHRDVKPENVLLATDPDSGAGRVKVADFGLARAISAETQHTATGGVLIGTVSYLSPELVVDGKADARSDVYATGVVLYEMLTGVKPHQADSAIQVAYKHVHEDVPPPSERVPGLPAYVDALVARATARDRDLRPSDARMLLHQVRRVRQALDHGITDDPELTADLMPRGHGVDRTGELDVAPMRTDPWAAPAFTDDVFDYDRTTPVPRVAPTSPPSSPPPAGPLAAAGAHGGGPGYATEKRSRRGPMLLIGVLVAALLVGLGGWYLGFARYTTTPSVISLTDSAARARIEKAGLHFQDGRPAYSETVTKGSVISTDPAPGDRVRDGGTITAVISLGPERHDVPTLRGQTQAAATTMLSAAKLTLGSVTQAYNVKIPVGSVIGSDPKAGEPLKRGAAVNLVISEGPQPEPIADWTGRRADKAEASLKALGFLVTVTQQNDATVPAGKVISQTPNSGIGHQGDTITLVVSKGPVLVQIPPVRGSRTDSAVAALEALGLNVTIERSVLYVGAGYVVGCSPGQGSYVPKGSTVILSIV